MMVTIDIAGISSMNKVKDSSPSNPISSFTMMPVKSMQETGPGGSIVMVLPLVKSESEVEIHTHKATWH